MTPRRFVRASPPFLGRLPPFASSLASARCAAPDGRAGSLIALGALGKLGTLSLACRIGWVGAIGLAGLCGLSGVTGFPGSSGFMGLACADPGPVLADPAPAAADPASLSADPPIVAHWRFDGDLKDSRGKLVLEPRGGEAVFEAGLVGGTALSLKSGRYVTTAKAPELELSAMTLELWFRPRFEPGKVPYNPCIVAQRNSSPETRFSVHLMSGYSELAIWNGKQVFLCAPGPGSLRPGEWYHLAITAAKDQPARLYLDGLEAALTTAPGTIDFEALGLPFQIGSSAPEGAELFEGAVDEVAVYSRVLTEDEIGKHMDAAAAKKRLTRAEVEAEIERRRAEADRAARERLSSYLSKKGLFSVEGEPQIYRGDRLGNIGLPVGGIGTGSILMDGKAGRPAWYIFGNRQAVRIPESFFAIRVGKAKADPKPLIRVLQTEAEGPFRPFRELSFRGEYPFGWFRFEDPEVPASVELEAFNPLVPGDLEASSIPCAVYRISVTNPGGERLFASVLGTQMNAVGCQGAPMEGRASAEVGGNTARLTSIPGGSRGQVLAMSAGVARGPTRPGSLALALLGAPPGTSTSGVASWERLEDLHAQTAANGEIQGPEEAGPTPAGRTTSGALMASFQLEPRATATVTFVLAWHFPSVAHGEGAWGGRGNMYENRYASAVDVIRELAIAADEPGVAAREPAPNAAGAPPRTRLDDLRDATLLYHDCLYASSLPRWLLDRVSSQVVVIRSPTCFWTRDGYFGGWEGCGASSGCCMGNCNHVWQYAQAHAYIFPELARLMREQAFRFQAPDGAIPHRQPSSFPALDGQCGDILGAYREHLLGEDGAWLSRYWGNVKRAMDYTIGRWDSDEDGILAGAQWNTLDGNLGGSSSWLGSMYLAALAASERMALIQGDPAAAARYAKIRQSGSKKQDATLWNGEYYVQIPDATPQQDYGTGCAIDQLLGQWWARQLDLGWLYPEDHVRTALRSLFRYNFRLHFHGVEQLPRRFVVDDDPGMQMITWPKGGRPAGHTQYASEVMSGFEYSAAAAMVQAGLLEEGFSVVRGASIRYDGRLKTGVDGGGAWGYTGSPFCDDECGKFYARPMSIWSVLLAAGGFVIDGPSGLIGFRPVWRPAAHVSFFTAPRAWGLFTQKRGGSMQREKIEVRRGRLRIRTLVFELPRGLDAAPRTELRHSRLGAIPVAHEVRGREVRLESRPFEVLAGESVEAEVSWRG